MYEITEEKIKELKSVHGDVYVIIVGDKQAVFRGLNRNDLSYATMASSQGKDTIKFAECILKNTYLEGDREIIDDDAYFLNAMQVANLFIQEKQTAIKKL